MKEVISRLKTGKLKTVGKTPISFTSYFCIVKNENELDAHKYEFERVNAEIGAERDISQPFPPLKTIAPKGKDIWSTIKVTITIWYPLLMAHHARSNLLQE
jgi:hypothetical protein